MGRKRTLELRRVAATKWWLTQAPKIRQLGVISPLGREHAGSTEGSYRGWCTPLEEKLGGGYVR